MFIYIIDIYAPYAYYARMKSRHHYSRLRRPRARAMPLERPKAEPALGVALMAIGVATYFAVLLLLL